MAAPESPGPGNPLLGFRFDVSFFTTSETKQKVNIYFQKVSGLGSSVETMSVTEGGQNLYSQSLPKRIKYDNLVLERGLVVGSDLTRKFIETMSEFKFSPSNVLVTLVDHAQKPIASWSFMKAYPVKWSISDLDANANSVVVERMELSYQFMKVTKI